MKMIFIGTGGGRFSMVTQKRRTGGIRIINSKANIHIDPGPGALVYSIEMGLDPRKLDGILISHAHPDHSNDAAVLIEAMSEGATRKRGFVFASTSVLYGNEVCEKVLSKYHQSIPFQVIEAKVNTSIVINDLEIKACKVVHSDPSAVGFRFKTQYGDFAYMPDSEYFDDIDQYYGNVKLIILSVLRSSGMPWEGHMCTDDVIKVIDKIKPEIAVITHFGMHMIMKNPDKEAKIIENKTNVKTIAAKDGMQIIFGEKIDFTLIKKQTDLRDFFR
ncbi:MAG: MBL fold metallo-hydrolase [Candidatus Methanomethylicia archaeon]|nr:MBL fold metallo-hydrolase [Candidatus Methanomethylicia archaeon]